MFNLKKLFKTLSFHYFIAVSSCKHQISGNFIDKQVPLSSYTPDHTRDRANSSSQRQLQSIKIPQKS
jgi:hypothetical protein